MLNSLAALIADLAVIVAATKLRTIFMAMMSLALIWVVLMLMR